MKTLSLLASICLLSPASLVAATISDPNIFNPGSSPATVNTSSEYPNPGFQPGYVVDLTGNQSFYDDGQPGHFTMSISNFSDPSGIGSIRFYDAEEFELGRVAQSVTIYTSSVNQTSLNSSDYTLLGTFTLTIGSNGFYNGGLATGATGSSESFGYYDTLSYLGIAPGTQSILLDYGNNPGIGAGFTEIQAFAPVPEPSTYAMLVGSLAFLGLCLRRKSVMAHA